MGWYVVPTLSNAHWLNKTLSTLRTYTWTRWWHYVCLNFTDIYNGQLKLYLPPKWDKCSTQPVSKPQIWFISLEPHSRPLLVPSYQILPSKSIYDTLGAFGTNPLLHWLRLAECHFHALWVVPGWKMTGNNSESLANTGSHHVVPQPVRCMVWHD